MSNGKPGDIGWVLTRASLTSDDPLFHRVIENMTPAYFGRAEVQVFADAVAQFLFVLHGDGSADIYVNDFVTLVEMLARRPMEAGAVVTDRDIADIRRVRFPGINFDPDDKVVYCFKAGWKFGLFFDLSSPRSSTVDELELAWGTLRRRLTYEHVYEGLVGLDAAYMRADGWFPFVELIGTDFRTLRDAYSPTGDLDGLVERVVASFDAARLKVIMARWWAKPVFKPKQALLEAGVEAFLSGTSAGAIQCIKTLHSELEGLIRSIYLEDKGRGSGVKIPELLQHVVERGEAKGESDQSMLLPKEFLSYLKEVLFAHFNVDRGDVELSRNSSSHGVARPDDYTRARALQAILAIDQLCFYV